MNKCLSYCQTDISYFSHQYADFILVTAHPAYMHRELRMFWHSLWHNCYCYWTLFNPLTQNVHKTWSYDISYHNSWYRSRKIKEDSSTEREKSLLQFEPIFITVQCTSRSQDFFLNENDQEIFKLATLLMIENPLFLMQIGNVWPKNHIFFIYFLFVMHYTCFGSAIKRN